MLDRKGGGTFHIQVTQVHTTTLTLASAENSAHPPSLFSLFFVILEIRRLWPCLPCTRPNKVAFPFLPSEAKCVTHERTDTFP